MRQWWLAGVAVTILCCRHLGVATIAVSGSWMLIVDSWPASGRLYIGGSTDNTVLDLALGCSGFGRVEETDLRWTYKRSARGRSIGA